MKYSEAAIGRVYSGNKYVKKNASQRGRLFFNLRVPESQKDFEYYKHYVEYIVPPDSATIDDYEDLKRNYEVYNDDLSSFKEDFKRFCDPAGENFNNIEEELSAFPVLHNKINVKKGEMMNRSDKYNVVLLSADAINSKNTKYLEAIKQSLNQELSIELERVQKEMEGMNEEEIDQYVEQKKKELAPADIDVKDFKSDTEIFYEKAIKYCYYDQHILTKKLESLEDTDIADRFFVYSGWRFGKPYLELRNTLFTGWQKAPNQRYINKGDYVWYKKAITVSDVLNYYGDKLTNEELNRLGVHRSNTVDERHSLDPKKQKYVRATFDDDLFRILEEKGGRSGGSKDVGTSQGQGLSRKSVDEFLIWETHIEFKGFRNLIFVSYVDDYQNEIVLPVDKSFKIPKYAEKTKFVNRWGNESFKYTWVDYGKEYTAEELWIPWKYEVVRLGEDVYPIYRPVPYQNPNIENPYSTFNLSTFGRVFTNRNAKSISLLRRAIPSYLQFLYVKHIQNRELAKYQGFIQDIDTDTIPDSLGEDINGELIKDPIAVWMVYRKKLGLNFYSGSQTVNGAPPPATRSPGSGAHIVSTAADIFNLQQLAELLQREIGLALGVPPQREAQFATNSNASDNRQALQQSYYMTEPYIHMIDEVWKQAIEDWINNFRVYCKRLMQNSGRAPIFHYVLPDGTEELLKVTDSMLNTTSVGIFLDSNVNQQRYNDLMMEYSQAFSQNAGEGVEIISEILKSITNGSSAEETHKLIQIASNKQQERQQQMQQAQMEAEKQVRQEEAKAKEQEHQYKLKEIELKETLSGQYDLEIAKLKAQVEENSTYLSNMAKNRQLDIKQNETKNGDVLQ